MSIDLAPRHFDDEPTRERYRGADSGQCAGTFGVG
jgi:hypothetical protein